MPITVLCPSCSATVNAPDSAAGRRAKCPKCQAVMLLPGEAMPPPVPPPSHPDTDEEDPPPRKRRRADDDEEDRPRRSNARYEDDEGDDDRPSRRRRDDDDDEDRPRRRRKKKQKPPAGSQPVAVGVFGLLVAVSVGLLTYRMFNREPDFKIVPPPMNPLNMNNIMPPPPVMPDVFNVGRPAAPAAAAGWVVFNEPGGRFTVTMPVQPQAVDLPNRVANPRVQEMRLWQTPLTDGRIYQAMFQSFKTLPPGEPPANFLDQICDGFSREAVGTLGNETSRKDTTLGGFRAKELTYRGPTLSAVVRLSFANRKVFAASVLTTAGAAENAEHTQAFFEGFQPK